MFPFNWQNQQPNTPVPDLPSSQQARDDIEFLLSLLPGWTLDPDPGLVHPGWTLEQEQGVAEMVKRIKARWFPPPPPPPPEEIEEDLIG